MIQAFRHASAHSNSPLINIRFPCPENGAPALGASLHFSKYNRDNHTYTCTQANLT